MSAFCLTAYMGESSAKCQKDTVSGTCKNYDKTGIFIPPPDIAAGLNQMEASEVAVLLAVLWIVEWDLPCRPPF